MSIIITVKCSKCGKEQKMEIRNPKFTVYNKPDLTNKRKICIRCEKSFKIDKNSVIN
jgi:DNA-directed RNA polymerase subunit RPC12/RpoP